MKRILVLIAAFVFTATAVSAQVAPRMKYKELKDSYNSKEYVKSANDPYSPGWSGFASFVLPGLGQAINGETGRGIAFFAGDLAIGVAANLCADKFMKYVQTDANGKPLKIDGKYVYTDDAAAGKWAGAIIGVSAIGVANYIWNICDARKVAKVKNMYYQDLAGKHAVGLDLYPSFDYAMTGEGARVVPGMTLSLQF
ncbi:MAG: hypothetical protein IJL42_03270 [Bacteroidales bacterium]|nr:hypothetical protein [Bacteroidales bacterium]